MSKTFHFLAGLPRSGSTLLADILCQNPAIHASSTSVMDRTYGRLGALWSEVSPEGVQAMLHRDERGAEARMTRYLKAGLEAWYEDVDRPVVVDKGRYWINHLEQLQVTHPQSKVICTVRNPLTCFASVQKLHARFPVLRDGPENEPLFAKTLRYFDPQKGMIGSNLVRVEDKLALPRRWPSLVWVVFEELVRHPKRAVQKLYADLELPWHEHDFERVEPTAQDLDALTNMKFRHDRPAGPVQDPKTDWREHVPEGMAQKIARDYPHVFSKWKEWF
jgi:sulfotransferase